MHQPPNLHIIHKVVKGLFWWFTAACRCVLSSQKSEYREKTACRACGESLRSEKFIIFFQQIFGGMIFLPYICTRNQPIMLCECNTYCGNSSVGRAQPCQGWGREFESRFPLIVQKFWGQNQAKPFETSFQRVFHLLSVGIAPTRWSPYPT